MEKKIVVNDKEYTIKEIPYIEAIGMGDTKEKVEIAKLMMKGCAGLTEDEIASLTLKEGLEIQKAIDEVNGLTAFQVATEKE